MAKKQTTSSDNGYFLKLVLYLILGSLWLKVTDNQSWHIPVPIGLVTGVIFASHDHFKIDRKIEYAVLLIATLIGFWAPIGIYISF